MGVSGTGVEGHSHGPGGQGVEFLMAPLSPACVCVAHHASDLSNPFSSSPLPQGPGPRPQQGLDGPIVSRPTSLSLATVLSGSVIPTSSNAPTTGVF